MPYLKKLGKKVRLAGIEEGCPTVVVENDYPAQANADIISGASICLDPK